MIALDRPYSCQYVLFAIVVCHNEQVATIEFLITEVYNTRMTTVMFS